MNARTLYRLANAVGGMEDEFALLILVQQEALTKGFSFPVSTPGKLFLKGTPVERVKDLVWWWSQASVEASVLAAEILQPEEVSQMSFLEIFKLPLRVVIFAGDEFEISVATGKTVRQYRLRCTAKQMELMGPGSNSPVIPGESTGTGEVRIKLLTPSPFRAVLTPALSQQPFLHSLVKKFELPAPGESRWFPEGGLIALLAYLDVGLNSRKSVLNFSRVEAQQFLLQGPQHPQVQAFHRLVASYQGIVEAWMKNDFIKIFGN